MNAAQVHRGPDAEGLREIALPGGRLVLGHRRLAILDLTAAGQQPMENPDTGDWLVFNGEIYNFLELRRELESWGATFRSRSDTEVILRAFQRWGSGCFERLDGMFAVAVYERSRARLYLARDGLGIKPLYYTCGPRGFGFASEVRGLVASGLIAAPRLDRRAVAGLLAYGAVPAPLTLQEQVRVLEPGICWQVELSRPPGSDAGREERRFWRIPEPDSDPARPAAVAEIRERLQAAARRHLLSDVPVGVFLSSGLDSTAVASLCAAGAGHALNTFTVGLAGMPEMDEGPLAERTARRLGARHHTITVGEQELRRRVEEFFSRIDQPSVDGLNTYIVSAAVRERGIKVALSGLGGDELFGGYAAFTSVPKLARLARLGQFVPRRLRAELASLAVAGRGTVARRKAAELAAAGPSIRSLCLRRRRLFSDADLATFGFSRRELDLTEDLLPPESEPDRDLAGRDAESQVRVLEARFYMGNMLLRDSDVLGMAHGLEIRVPLLDRQVLDFVFRLPGQWLRRRGHTNKPLLVDALGDRLDSDLGQLPKRGFNLPYAKWMAGPLRGQVEGYLGSLRSVGVMQPDAIDEVWREFLSGSGGAIAWSRAWLLGVLGCCVARQQAVPLPHLRALAA